MTKFFSLVAAAIIALGSQAQASTFIDAGQLQAQATVQAQLMGLNWNVGDQADYKISIGGFINGTAHSFVSKDEGTSIWMQQDMDLGFAGKQKIEVQFEKATGKILKMLANGQEQQVPDQGDVEVVEMREDNVTVPAGSFPCIYAKIKSKKDNSIQEAWINPQVVPMSGMLKALADSQFGKVTQEATKFSFAK